MVCLLTYRGYAKMIRRGEPVAPEALTAELMSRPDLDSAALITEPTLAAWGIPYLFWKDDADLTPVSDAFLKAEQEQRPIALLLARDLT
jgi:hypothetical protein